MSIYGELAMAAMYARLNTQSVWLEVTEDGIRARGVSEGQHAERQVPWINLEQYRNGAQALLEKTIDEVSAMLAKPREDSP